MNIRDNFEALKARFVYKAEDSASKKVDDWKVLALEGKVYGDCEDFALTLAKAHYGSLFKAYLKGAKLANVRYNGQGHAILVTDDGCFDNIMPRAFDVHNTKGYEFRKNYWLIIVYVKLALAKILN